MADDFAPVRPGEDVRFSARTWNAMMKAGRAFLDSEFTTGTSPGKSFRQADIIKVLNDSGQDLQARSVLGLEEPLFSPGDNLDSFLRDVTFRAVTPTASHAGKFCVLLDPAVNGAVARAYVDGLTHVKVMLDDPGDECADVADGETAYLATGAGGSASLIWFDSVPYDDSGARWAIIRFGAGCASDPYGNTFTGRCDCPEDEYEVDADCGNCGAYYGYYDDNGVATKMPKYWWLTIRASTDTYYAYYDDCNLVTCNQLEGYKVRMAHGGGCSWYGHNDQCVHGELLLDGDVWKLTVMDNADCVLGVFRKSQAAFNCCGTNDGWAADPNNSCDMSVSVEPDPCTCCPDKTCPPDGRPVCSSSPCCYHDCTAVVAVRYLHTPAPTVCQFGVTDCVDLEGNPCTFPDTNCFDAATVPAPPARCGALNGTYNMTWVKDCTWVFKGYPEYFPGEDPENPASGSIGGRVLVRATLTLTGRKWELKLRGDKGQIANFEHDGDCSPTVDMQYAGGSCTHEGQFFTPVATVALA